MKLTPQQQSIVESGASGGRWLKADDRSLLTESVWKAALVVGAEIEKTPAHGGSSRDAAKFVEADDGSHSAVAVTWTRGQADGTQDVYEVTVSVTKTVDSRDGYWEGMVDYPHAVVVKGVHYVIGAKTTEPAHCKGFGGRTWKVKFFDGREETTDNMWYQGPIPPVWRERIPDNAEFI